MAVKTYSLLGTVLALLAGFVLPESATAQGACTSVGVCTSGATLDEYRHKPSGVHFYTACTEEKATLASLPDVFEATGRAIPYTPATGTATAPLTRFFFSGGTLAANRHFYTTIGAEAANLGLTGFNWGFQLCSEGERGRAFEPQGLATSTAPPPIDPRLTLVSAANAFCGRLQMPIWRVLQSSPVQHRLAHRFDDYLSDLSAASADDEGIRLCLAAPWATVQTQVVPPTSALTDTTDREITVTVVAPDGATAIQLGVALPPNVEVTGYADAIASGCTTSGAAASGRLVQCALPASPTLTRSGKLLVRAAAGYSTALPGRVRAYAVANTAPAGIVTNARACTGIDRPMHGCSVAELPAVTISTALPSFTIGSIAVTGLVAEGTGGTGNLNVPITTTQPSDAGKTIRLFSEYASPGSSTFSYGGLVELTLPPNGSSTTAVVPLNSANNPADLRVCVTTPDLSPGFTASQRHMAGCQSDPANNRKSAILPNVSFGTPATPLRVSALTIPSTAEVGGPYSGSFFCQGPAGTVCLAENLPTGLSYSCGPQVSGEIICTITGTPTTVEFRNVALRANAPSGATVSQSVVIDVRGATTPPATASLNLGSLNIANVTAGTPNSFRVTVQANSDPATSVRVIVYVKEASASTWTIAGGNSDVNLNFSPQTLTYDLTTTATNFIVRVCATKAHAFSPHAQCQPEIPADKPSGDPVYLTSAPTTVGPPPALVNLAWQTQPPTGTQVGSVAGYVLAARSQDSTNLATGPLWAHIGLPANWALDTASSPGCTQSGQRATCPILASGPLSASTPILVNLGLKPMPRAGGVSGAPVATVTNTPTPPTSITCPTATPSCITGAPQNPSYYDLIPQTTSATPPSTGGSTTLSCTRAGTADVPADATCRLEITYTDSTVDAVTPVPYVGATAAIVLCANDAPSDATCSHRVAPGKTIRILRTIAIDGAVALDNDPDNNQRVVFDSTPPPAPSINTSGMPTTGTQGSTYSGSFYCEGANTLDGFACNVSGLPAGLMPGSCTTTTTSTTRRLTCPVTGTPTTQGIANVTFSATSTNAVGPGNASMTINIGAPFLGCTPDPSAQLLEDFSPDADPMSFRIRKIPNGLHYIRLRPSALWKLGPGQTSSSVFYWEGLLAISSNRIITLSKCPGDTSADQETFNILSGDDAMGGQMYIYAIPSGSPPEPSNFPTKRTNGLPGLGTSTSWYVNIRQTTCDDATGSCRFNYHIWP